MNREMPPLPMPDSFEPDANTGLAFRQALGRFGTGVAVITCAGPNGPMGITANSFASVSLDPPLVLWSPAKASLRFTAFSGAERFAIHIMSAQQADICSGFAKTADAFDGFDWHANAQDVPLISHCLARFECSQEAVHDAGDHAIVVGRVTRVSTQSGEPLMFYYGKYGRFSE